MANIVLSILGKDDTAPAVSQATGHLKGLEGIARATKAVVAGVGLAAAAGVFAIAKTGIGEAMDGSAGLAQLQAGLKSTHNAANVTTGGMENLASSIQGMSGQTDDSIVKTEQLLLTFTNIKNQGPNKIFDDTTRAAADMAAKMGGDASSQAILLGKALNDPEQGLGRLSKVGVTFTDGQKAQVAAMMKSGNTAGAQKVILNELSKEFGGAAKAAGESLPGQLARGQRAFEDMSQTVVETILPVVLPLIGKLAAALKAATPVIEQVAQVVAQDLAAAFNFLGPILAGIFGWLSKNTWVIPPLIAILGILALAFGAVTVALWAMSLTPVVLIIIGIVAAVALLVAGVVLLVTHWQNVVDFFRGIWAGVAKWFGDTLKSIGNWWSSTWNGAISLFRTVWNAIVSFGVAVVRGYISTIQAVFSAVISWLRGLLNGYLSFWRGVWNNVSSAGLSIIQGFISTARGIWNGLVSFLRGVFSGIGGAFRNSWNGAISFLRGIPDTIRGVFSGIGGWLINSGAALIGGFAQGIRNAVGGAISAVSGVVSAVSKFFPHSPAPEGPFSGSGWTHFSGAALIDGFSGGMTSRAGAARSTISGVLSSLTPSLSMSGLGVAGAAGSAAAVAGGAAGGITIGAIHTHHGANASEIVNEISWQARRMPV